VTDQAPEDREIGLKEDVGPEEPDERVEGVPGEPPGSPETPSAGPLRVQAAPPQPQDDAYLRLAADFDNYKKRVARDQAELVQRATERLVQELLPVLDDLERALEAAEQHQEAKLEDGVRLVHRALAEVLRKEGIEEIATEGAFDPHVHEALLTQPGNGVEAGDVLQVLQKGYRLGDKVVRPARVIVAE
jgi:molecular chaperone GrpE